MALSRKKSRKGNFQDILRICLIFGGGLLIFVIFYNAFYSSTDTRSKAATPQVTLKTWNFDQNAEGWTVKSIPSSVQDSRLTFPLRVQLSPVMLLYGGVAPIPDRLGGKKVKIRIAAATGDQQVLGTEDNQVVLTSSEDQQRVSVTSTSNQNFMDLLRQWVSVYRRRSNLPEVKQLPTPACFPRPACLDANPPCQVMPPYNGRWCSSSPTPTPTCIARPACLDATPPCTIQLLPGQALCPEPPPSGGVVLMQLLPPEVADKNVMDAVGMRRIPVDGVMREYEMPLVSAKKIALQFSTQKKNASTIRLYVDWIKISANQVLTPTPTPYEFNPDYWCDSSPCPTGYRCIEPPNPCPNGGTCAFRPYCVKSTSVTPTPSIPPNCHTEHVCTSNGPCFERLVCPTNTPSPSNSVTGCRVTGCSGQICSDQEVASTCEYRTEYACYRTATCTRLNTGRCGWVQNAALTECIARARGSAESDYNR